MSKRKSLSVEVKQTKMTDSNTSVTSLPEFDIVEENSKRKEVIERLYDPTTPREHKEVYKLGIKKIERKITEYCWWHWETYGEIPEELGTTIKFSYEEKRLANKRQCDFKIEDWSDLVIKINVYDCLFHKVSSSVSTPFTLKQLKWTGLKLEILKDLSVGVYKPRSQQVNNAISELNKQISYLVGMDINPIETKGYRKSQYRVSNVKIELYDADERLMDAQKKTDRVYFSKNYDDGYQRDALQRHISVDEDDID